MSSNDSSEYLFLDANAQHTAQLECRFPNTYSRPTTPQSSRSPSSSPDPEHHDLTSFNDTDCLESPEFHYNFCYTALRSNFRLITSDNVLYHVHRQVLRRGSKSATLSVILHTVYEMPFEYPPALSTLIVSVQCFPTYGLEPLRCLEASTHLYAAVSSYNASTPLLVYTFAAKLGLEDLAVGSSEYMISFVPKVISDNFARAIGTQYLRRLFQLQYRRTRALTKILLKPLQMHSPIEECTQVMQLGTTRAWKTATASLVLKAHPTVSCAKIDATYRSVAESVECEYCRDFIDSRVQSMLGDWSKEKGSLYIFLLNDSTKRDKVNNLTTRLCATFTSKSLGCCNVLVDCLCKPRALCYMCTCKNILLRLNLFLALPRRLPCLYPRQWILRTRGLGLIRLDRSHSPRPLGAAIITCDECWGLFGGTFDCRGRTVKGHRRHIFLRRAQCLQNLGKANLQLQIEIWRKFLPVPHKGCRRCDRL
ncbi:hypothetical protein CPB85DRAFT_834842 [Mucidula mucida]|nr:hypothetical protein CPB85DRAFT_834842 [Mucidula mucida]